MEKRNIAIVCGGDSSEHDVSMRSAQGLYSFFDKERYNVYIAELKGLDWHVDLPGGGTAPIDRRQFSFKEGGRTVFIDYAYITIHGTPGENGLLQGYFDLLGIPYSTSGVLTEALTFHKWTLNRYLSAFGINTADSILLRMKDRDSVDEAMVEERLGMPCFVKPAAGGSSFGVSKVKNRDQLAPALRKAFMESGEVMVEALLSGTEISVGCFRVGEETTVLPATEVVTANEFFDYDAKYNGQVEEITPARIPEATAALVRDTTARIYDILGCNGIIRIDYIISNSGDGDKLNLIEVNTTPGMTATSFIPQQVKAAGLDISKVLADIVENQF